MSLLSSNQHLHIVITNINGSDLWPRCGHQMSKYLWWVLSYIEYMNEPICISYKQFPSIFFMEHGGQSTPTDFLGPHWLCCLTIRYDQSLVQTHTPDIEVLRISCDPHYPLVMKFVLFQLKWHAHLKFEIVWYLNSTDLTCVVTNYKLMFELVIMANTGLGSEWLNPYTLCLPWFYTCHSEYNHCTNCHMALAVIFIWIPWHFKITYLCTDPIAYLTLIQYHEYNSFIL